MDDYSNDGGRWVGLPGWARGVVEDYGRVEGRAGARGVVKEDGRIEGLVVGSRLCPDRRCVTT